jgi:hypothetical protein
MSTSVHMFSIGLRGQPSFGAVNEALIRKINMKTEALLTEFYTNC